jgi:F-type H+-transporting ATPase subunit alpha
VGLSVSRVGGSAQIKAMKKVAGQLRLDLAQYRELAAFAQFGSDLDESTKKQIDRGQRLTELLKQPQYSPLQASQQVTLLYAASAGLFDAVPVSEVQGASAFIASQLPILHSDLLKEIETSGELSDKGKKEIESLVPPLLSDYQNNVA